MFSNILQNTCVLAAEAAIVIAVKLQLNVTKAIIA